jgi:hypothetical protein
MQLDHVSVPPFAPNDMFTVIKAIKNSSLYGIKRVAVQQTQDQGRLGTLLGRRIHFLRRYRSRIETLWLLRSHVSLAETIGRQIQTDSSESPERSLM